MTKRQASEAAGFTLIELLVALAITVLLLVLAAPAYSTWIADQQIRAATESVASGLRLAHAEAIRRNWQVEFVITPTGASRGWAITQVGSGTPIQEGRFVEGSEGALFEMTPGGSTTVTFNGFGGIVDPNADASAIMREIEVTHPASGSRTLAVLVGGGRTGIKICDPAVTDTASPRYCTVSS